MNTWSQIVIVLATVAGGQLGVSVISWLRNRKGDKAKAAREQKAHDEASTQAAIDRATLLAESQRIAQTTALDSVGKANLLLERQCSDCLGKLRKMEKRDQRRDRIEDAMLDAMVEIVPLLPADSEHTAALRAAIHTARRARYELDNEDE